MGFGANIRFSACPSDFRVPSHFGVLLVYTITNKPIYIFLYTERWFLRWKFRQWARLRDANQDGVISQEDMRKTNAKLECLLKPIGSRRTVLFAEDQKKWWNDTSLGEISVEDNTSQYASSEFRHNYVPLWVLFRK